MKTATKWVVIGAAVFLVAWTVIASPNTVSRQILEWSQLVLTVPYALGALIGHWLMPWDKSSLSVRTKLLGVLVLITGAVVVGFIQIPVLLRWPVLVHLGAIPLGCAFWPQRSTR